MSVAAEQVRRHSPRSRANRREWISGSNGPPLISPLRSRWGASDQGTVGTCPASRGRLRALERALSNLLDNAVKVDPNGGDPIEVHVRADRVEVLDRGPGVAAADAPHVFERFYRATTARSLTGSGLATHPAASPVSSDAYRELPFVFAGSAMAAGGGMGPGCCVRGFRPCAQPAPGWWPPLGWRLSPRGAASAHSTSSSSPAAARASTDSRDQGHAVACGSPRATVWPWSARCGADGRGTWPTWCPVADGDTGHGPRARSTHAQRDPRARSFACVATNRRARAHTSGNRLRLALRAPMAAAGRATNAGCAARVGRRRARARGRLRARRRRPARPRLPRPRRARAADQRRGRAHLPGRARRLAGDRAAAGRP